MLLLSFSCFALSDSQSGLKHRHTETHSFSLKKNRATQNPTLQDHRPQISGCPDMSFKLMKFHKKSYHQVVIQAVRAEHRTMTQLPVALCIFGLQTDCSSAEQESQPCNCTPAFPLCPWLYHGFFFLHKFLSWINLCYWHLILHSSIYKLRGFLWDAVPGIQDKDQTALPRQWRGMYISTYLPVFQQSLSQTGSVL